MILLHAAEVSNTGNPAVCGQVFTPVNCAGLTKANGILRIDVKASNPAILTETALEITSFGSPDHEEWAIFPVKDYISTAYQTFDFVLENATTSDGELVVTEIDYIRWYWHTTGANVTLYWRNAYILFSNVYPQIITC